MSGSLLGCVVAVLVCFAAGCAGETLDEESVDSSEEALVNLNSLSPNSLSPNSLSPNSLSPNSLSPNSLSPSSLAAIQAPTADGAAARQLLRYTVSCALDPSQSFAFSWTDADATVHDEVYPGLLGIAPTWATSPLNNDTAQRMVSSCLAARVNYYGQSVMISVRSLTAPLKTLAGSPELAAYPHIEGAFWGNLFVSTPYLNACYEAANVNISRNALRDCAAGHLSGGQTVPCGMIALRGSCCNLCQTINSAGQYYPSCKDHPEIANSPFTQAVITTALP